MTNVTANQVHIRCQVSSIFATISPIECFECFDTGNVTVCCDDCDGQEMFCESCEGTGEVVISECRECSINS